MSKIAAGSDESYDADTENPPSQAPPQQSAPSAAVVEAKEAPQVSQPSSACTDKIRAFLSKHQHQVKSIQEVLLWKRPVTMVAIIFAVEFAIWAHKKMKLSFFAQISLYTIIFFVGSMIYPMVSSLLAGIFFSGEVPQGEKTENDHIRSVDEICEGIDRISKPLIPIVEIFKHFADDESISGLLIQLGFLFLAFLITANVDMFSIFSILVNICLLFPGTFFNPKLRTLIGNILNKPHQE